MSGTTIALIVLAAFVGLVLYAFVAMLAFRAITRRCSYETEPVGGLAGLLWPIGVPLVLGAWLARRALARRST